MGCDGGTIPKRDELVKVKKKPEVKDKQAELSFKWRCCDISQEALDSYIVTCGLGRLYNKSSVIEGLLNRTMLPASAKHIRNLKDIKDLNLTPNPEYDLSAEKTEGMIDVRGSPFICPVTGLEMSGQFRFICLWSCGCVMSERALKQINTKICHKCQMPFTKKDVIVLNGNEEDQKKMHENMEERQALEKARRKLNRIFQSGVMKTEEPITTTDATPSTSSYVDPATSSSAQPTNSTALATAILKTKLKRLTETTDNDLQDPEIKKMKMDYSVAKDPKVTDVYKSLFTTHQSERDQTRAHWVTYNPFYN